jgi:hypothetical protein
LHDVNTTIPRPHDLARPRAVHGSNVTLQTFLLDLRRALDRFGRDLSLIGLTTTIVHATPTTARHQ